MSCRTYRRLRSFGCGFLSALALTVLVVVGTPSHRCEAAQTGWMSLSSAVSPPAPAHDAGRLVRTGQVAGFPGYAAALRRPDDHAMKIILAVVLAAVIAFDLWILRHLRQVYLSDRRSRRRLGCESRRGKQTGPPYIDGRP